MSLTIVFACSMAFFFFPSDSGLKAETNQLRFTSPWMLYVSGVDVYTRATGLNSLWHEWREISGQSMIYLTYLRHLDLVGCSCCIASVYFPQLQSNREINIRRRLLCHWEQFFKCCSSAFPLGRSCAFTNAFLHTLGQMISRHPLSQEVPPRMWKLAW